MGSITSPKDGLVIMYVKPLAQCLACRGVLSFDAGVIKFCQRAVFNIIEREVVAEGGYWSGRVTVGRSPIPAVGDDALGRVDHQERSLRVGWRIGRALSGSQGEGCDQSWWDHGQGACVSPCLRRMPPGPALSKSHHLPTAKGRTQVPRHKVQRCEDILQQLRGCGAPDGHGRRSQHLDPT